MNLGQPKKTRKLGVRKVNYLGEHLFAPYDLESGEDLTGIVSCSVISEVGEPSKATITFYVYLKDDENMHYTHPLEG